MLSAIFGVSVVAAVAAGADALRDAAAVSCRGQSCQLNHRVLCIPSEGSIGISSGSFVCLLWLLGDHFCLGPGLLDSRVA